MTIRGDRFDPAWLGLKNIFEILLTRAGFLGRIENCSARQSAYRAGGGEISEADKNGL
jgi:hypothetical protein